MPPSKRVPREYPVAQVVAVHDGDTVRVLVDTGFDGWARVWVRLQGVTAKELHQEGGVEAKANLASILNQYTEDGWVKLVTFWSSGVTKEIKEERTFIRYVGRLVSTGAIDINEVQAASIAGTPMEGGS